jgi:hypothetical protein
MQFTIRLQKIGDTEKTHCKNILCIQGMLPSRHNTFSNANCTRDPVIAEAPTHPIQTRIHWSFRARHRLLCILWNVSVLFLLCKPLEMA